MSSLAVTYRPRTLSEMVGQQSIVKILTKQLEKKEFVNTYLFCGASGCGKTTAARAMALAINEGQGIPIEIDAASNSGVSNVRDIISEAKERALDSTYKIYIIDECHALSAAAWQAFLKCIEEPPKYTIFFFCTTDPQKIPPTILNRCMRFEFNRIPSDIIKSRLSYICEQEHFISDDAGIEFIAKISKGQMRDAIANLEKVSAYSNQITIDNVMNVLGNYSYSMMFGLLNALIDGNAQIVFSSIEYLYNDGADLKIFADQFLTFALDVMKYSIFKNCDVIQIPASMQNELNSVTSFNDADKYYSYVVDKLLSLKNMLKTDTNPKNTCEVMLLQICRCQ